MTTQREQHKVPLLRWPSILASDAFQKEVVAPKNKPTIIKRTITSEEDGAIKDPQTLARDIALEAGKFYNSLLPANEQITIEAGAAPIKPFRSVPAIEIPDKILGILSRPESFSTEQKRNEEKRKMNQRHNSIAQTDSIPVIPYQRRKSSVTGELLRRFNYDDPELELKVSHRGIIVMGGTKQKLIDLLTDLGFMEIQYISEFLGVYPYFATTSELLHNLMNSYESPYIPENLTMKESIEVIQRTKKRVHFILRRWVETYPRQFYDDPKTVETLNLFISQLDDESARQRLMNLVQKNILSHEGKYDFLTPRIVTPNCKSPLFMKSVDILAQQLCLLDQKQLCKIDTHELKGQKWTKKNAFSRTPKITRCIEFFNRLSYWCATEILTRKSMKDRLKAIKRIICLAKRCAVYHNYNSAFAITSALNFSSVSRLKKTWKALSSKYANIHKEMQELCKVEANYFPYKQLLLHQTPPLVPYLGVFLRDLTFLEVGNPTYLDSEDTMINYDKFRMIASVLLDFQKYQQVLYQFPLEKQVQTAFRYSLVTLDENELFELSYAIEPRLSKS